MSLRLEFGPGAKQDFDEASDWYQWQDPPLKTAFIGAVGSALERVRTKPESFPIVFGGFVRRAIVSKFPFVIIFTEQEDRIYVYSVFHTSRNPVIWKGRID